MSGDERAVGPDGHEYGLLMPFVVTTSHGGPCDDDAYVAGWEAGAIDNALLHRLNLEGPLTVQLVATVRSGNVDQMDLIAMRRGFRMIESHAVPGMEDEWSTVVFAFAGSPT